MMFIIRGAGDPPRGEGFTVRLTRRTPAIVQDGTVDFFCAGGMDAARALNFNVVPVHDGWYADDTGGGIAIWGAGRFWEIRDTPFTVKESSDGAETPADTTADGETADVRKAIFGV